MGQQLPNATNHTNLTLVEAAATPSSVPDNAVPGDLDSLGGERGGGEGKGSSPYYTKKSQNLHLSCLLVE